MFDGVVAQDETHTLYAGSLDDPSPFEPKIGISDRDRLGWAMLPPRLAVVETTPVRPNASRA